MKKFTTLFSATVLAIGMLAGCGTAKKENTTPQSTAAPESTTQVSEPTDSVESTAPEAEVTTITVGMDISRMFLWTKTMSRQVMM